MWVDFLFPKKIYETSLVDRLLLHDTLQQHSILFQVYLNFVYNKSY